MTTAEFLASGWQPKWEVVGGGALILAGYVALAGPPSRRAPLFLAGVLLLVLSLVSPLDTLAHEYLFSAHMAQHLLMTLAVPPLLILGTPAPFFARLLAARLTGWLEAGLGHPAVAWGAAAATVWVWHLPALYGAALAHEGLHILQHGLFLGTATLFWWVVIAPLPARSRLAPWAAILYLFAAMAASSLLGILLAFASPGLYAAYLHPGDTLGILPLVRETWGLSPAADQQLGGFLIWIPGGFVYSLALFGVLIRWFGGPEDAADGSTATTVAARTGTLET